MKISEMTQRLLAVEKEFGDIEVKLLQSVTINDEEKQWQANITEVDVDWTSTGEIIVTLY